MILIKYGELNTKKDNIKYFIKSLTRNIKEKLKDYNIIITSNRAHTYIDYNDNEEEIVNILKTIPGIHSFTIATKCKTDIDDIKNKTKEIVQNINFKTFKIDTKRSYKEFEYNTPQINNILGGVVLKSKDNINVNVHNPELTITIEVRQDNTYIYYKEEKGLGGFPQGVGGKSLVMISGGIDSPVAAFQAIKKGIKIECIYFEALPHTSLSARQKVIDLVKKLEVYTTYPIKIHIINFTKIQEDIYKNCDKEYTITIMRRIMYEIAEQLSKKIKATSIINGESIGQVASQTQESIRTINEVTNFPILRPCIFMDKLDIIKISKEIDTYNISILPYEDCCTIFVPTHPVIKPTIKKAKEEQSKLNYDIKEIIDNRLIIKTNKKEYSQLL